MPSPQGGEGALPPEELGAEELSAMASVVVVAEARSYYSVWLTLKDSDTVDEFYKYRGEELPEVDEVIEVVRFLRDRATRARVTRVDARHVSARSTKSPCM